MSDYPVRYNDIRFEEVQEGALVRRRLDPEETYHRLEFEWLLLRTKRQELGEEMRQTWAAMTAEERKKYQAPPLMVSANKFQAFINGYTAWPRG